MMFDTSVFETQPWLALTIVLLAVWSYVWKALALYRAGYNRSPIWFFFLLIVNTVGILDIFYLFVFGRKKR